MKRDKYLIIGIFLVATFLFLSGCAINIDLSNGNNAGEVVQRDENQHKEGQNKTEKKIENGREDTIAKNNREDKNGNENASSSEDMMQTEEVERFCGNGTCENGEEDSCCSDCGCQAGYFCGTNDICATMPTLKPLPKPELELFATPENSFNFKPLDKIKFSGIKEGQENPKRISVAGEGSVSYPSIYGNKVVFHKDLPEQQRAIYIYDLQSEELTKVPHSGSAPMDPDMGNGYIVWTDVDDSASKSINIYYYDFTNNKEGFISPRDRTQRSPVAFGNTIVWEEEVNDNSEALYMYWLPSQEERRIFYHPQVKILSYNTWNAYVVYAVADDISKANGTSKLYYYDIAKRKNNVILTLHNEDGINKYIKSVSIWDKNIVYVSSSHDGDNVYVYNLDTKLTRKISDNANDKGRTAIYKNKVLWEEKHVLAGKIYLYDLDDKQGRYINENSIDDRGPDIYGDIVVYQKSNKYINVLTLD